MQVADLARGALCAHRERPCGCRATEQRDGLAPFQLIELPSAAFRNSRILRRKQLRHYITSRRTKFAVQATVFNVAIGSIKTTGRLSARECTPQIASFHRPSFECTQHRPTDSPEPRIRRDVVQCHFSSVGDRTDREDRPVFDSYEAPNYPAALSTKQHSRESCCSTTVSKSSDRSRDQERIILISSA